MKQLLFFILFTVIMILLFGCKSYGQIHSDMALGYDTHGRAIASLSVGVTASEILEIQGEIRPSLSRSSFSHNYAGFRGGLRLINLNESTFYVSLGGGYFHDLKSNDHKELNKNYFGTYIKGVQMINDRGGVLLDLLYINNSLQVSTGIHYVFN